MVKKHLTLHATYILFSILMLNLVVGVLGFGFHLFGDLAGTQSIVWERMMYRNPLLGPLLFCNLALLGGLSLLPEPIGMADCKIDETVAIARLYTIWATYCDKSRSVLHICTTRS